MCGNVQGVPASLRKCVWSWVSGVTAKSAEISSRNKDGFAEYLETGKGNKACAHQIDLDVPRTFPKNAWVQSDVGQEALRRVLYAFSGRNTSIGYCQGMNYVAALLVVILDYDERAAFWVMCCLIGGEDGETGSILYKGVYSRDLSGCHVEMRSLNHVVNSKLPRLTKHMKRLDVDISMIATEWFLCLYATTFPAETVARVWDSLLLEGPKVLFRVAIALLKIHEPMLLAADNAGELLKLTRTAAMSEYNRDELLKVAFDGIGPLAMNTIHKIRDENQRLIDKQIALRETKEKLRRAVSEQGLVVMEGEEELMNADEGTCALDDNGTDESLFRLPKPRDMINWKQLHQKFIPKSS